MPGLVRHALMKVGSAAISAGSAIILRYDCGLVKRPIDGFPVHAIGSVMHHMERPLSMGFFLGPCMARRHRFAFV